jgi:hypothetical protein
LRFGINIFLDIFCGPISKAKILQIFEKRVLALNFPVQKKNLTKQNLAKAKGYILRNKKGQIFFQ